MLEKLASYHQDWLKIAYSFLNDKENAEDIVQDMYLRLYDYKVKYKNIKYKDEVNRYFIYTVIKNMCLQHIKKDPHNLRLDDVWLEFHENYDTSRHMIRIKQDKYKSQCLVLLSDYFMKKKQQAEFVRIEDLLEKVQEEIETWDFYEKNLFEVYMYSGLSFRDLAYGSTKDLRYISNKKFLSASSVRNGTGISVSSMFHTIKKCKQKLRKKLGMYSTKHELRELITKSIPTTIVSQVGTNILPFNSYRSKDVVIDKITDYVYEKINE